MNFWPIVINNNENMKSMIILLLLFLTSCANGIESRVYEINNTIYAEYSRNTFIVRDNHLEAVIREYMVKHPDSEFYVIECLDSPLFIHNRTDALRSKQILIGTYSPSCSGMDDALFPDVKGFCNINGRVIIIMKSTAADKFFRMTGARKRLRYKLGECPCLGCETYSIIDMIDRDHPRLSGEYNCFSDSLLQSIKWAVN